MKITYTACTPRCTKRIGSLQPGTVVRLLNTLQDSSDKDPFLIVDMRSYGSQLDEMGCYSKIGVVNLKNNKLSIIRKDRCCTEIEDVEVCIP